ncbi:unnamed protein product [Parnassius apollo]|uniref:(apollo) hypothetical protein n=1 Tax=Parnassius apollo TaxID=110799 RepID=A0A8S3XEH7_PARAO|nr:unnamed protein product [Parnassius apollo]
MLDDFEREHCASCRALKCCCSDIKPTATELTDSGRISQASCKTKSVDSKEAPLAKSLPKPKWDKQLHDSISTPERESNEDVEAWVETVTPSAPATVREIKRNLNLSATSGGLAIPCSPLKSAWVDGETSMQVIGTKNAVEKFFRSFRGYSPYSPAQTTLSFMSSRLATTFKVTPKKSYEYTYF